MTRRTFLSIMAAPLVFLFLALTILRYGHVHEDAYILFQYSKNLAQGLGIVFDRASGHAEGATDFLWMITISGMIKLGISPAIAAAILNALGFTGILYVVYKLRPKIDFVFFAVSLSILLSGGSAAALGGFSTLAYGSLLSCLFLFAHQEKYIWLTTSAIVIALFRPDGAVLSFGAFLGALVMAKPTMRPKILIYILGAIGVGSIYFIWRYKYFQMLLPLPLEVKQKVDSPLEGLANNLNAIKFYLPALALIIYRAVKTSSFRNFLFLVTPGVIILFVLLSLAHQSQNIGFRFQLPIILAIILSLVYLTKVEADSSTYKLLVTLSLLISIYGNFDMFSTNIKYLTNNDYINSLPQILRIKNFSVENIALTEAGRFPFWYNAATMTDLIGLNSKSVVIQGAEATLEETAPKLIFVHHAGRFVAPVSSAPLVEVPSKDIHLIGTYSGKNPVMLAPEYALKYAQKHSFQAIFVRYGSDDTSYFHVYFLSPELNVKLFLESLQESLQLKIPYLSSTIPRD